MSVEVTDQMVDRALDAWANAPLDPTEAMRAALTAALNDPISLWYADRFQKDADMPLIRYDMRRPSNPSFDDAMEVRVCRTLWGRISGAIWLLFTNHRPTPALSPHERKEA